MSHGSSPKNRRKNSQLLAASDVLQALLQNSKSELADGFLRWKLEQQWEEVVGKMIAEQTMPASYQRGTLHIWVRHSAWMQQLWYFQETIKEKINLFVGKTWVKEVRLTLDRGAIIGNRSSGASRE